MSLPYPIVYIFEETAEILGIAVPTANRWWAFARACLFHEIKLQRQDSPGMRQHLSAVSRPRL